VRPGDQFVNADDHRSILLYPALPVILFARPSPEQQALAPVGVQPSQIHTLVKQVLDQAGRPLERSAVRNENVYGQEQPLRWMKQSVESRTMTQECMAEASEAAT
jgi:hypothetical protein